MRVMRVVRVPSFYKYLPAPAAQFELFTHGYPQFSMWYPLPSAPAVSVNLITHGYPQPARVGPPRAHLWSAYALSSVSSSACRFRPPGWRGSGPCRFSVNSIPESTAFRASSPIHVGRIRFVSIQSLSGGRLVVGKFWPPLRLVISDPRCLLGSLLNLFSILVTGTNCNELGGGRRPLYSDATGVGRSGSHKEQQTHSGDGICWFNDYKI